MAGILEYSSSAASNTTLNGIGIAGSNSVKNGDDALRQLMADTASAITKVVDKTGTYTALKSDFNQMIRATGTLTLNLTAAATLTAGWCLWVKADGGAVTIDPNSTEQINGASTLVIADGGWCFIVCTGTAFRAVAVTLGSSIEATVHAASSKATPVDADETMLVDSAASNGLKKLTWANIKATLKTYFDTLYYIVGGTDVAVADGGTGRSSHTAYAVLCGGTATTAAQQSIASVGSSGQVLTSNGAGALPTFQSVPVDYASGNAALNALGVGTYCLVRKATSGAWTTGSNIAGSSLRVVGTATPNAWTTDQTLSGTWQNMGYGVASGRGPDATIAMRVS
jgi:hypothetical protein